MSEQSEAARDGAVLQPNSGRGKFRKGDAILKNFVIDYKEYSESYSVSRKNWRKACTDAFKVGLRFQPIIAVALGPDNDKVRVGIMDWDHMKELIDIAERYKELTDG